MALWAQTNTISFFHKITTNTTSTPNPDLTISLFLWRLTENNKMVPLFSVNLHRENIIDGFVRVLHCIVQCRELRPYPEELGRGICTFTVIPSSWHLFLFDFLWADCHCNCFVYPRSCSGVFTWLKLRALLPRRRRRRTARSGQRRNVERLECRTGLELVLKLLFGIPGFDVFGIPTLRTPAPTRFVAPTPGPHPAQFLRPL